MEKLLLLAFIASLPSTGLAFDHSQILGKWACHAPAETVDGLTTAMGANVEFKKNGTFHATMKLIFKDPELEATALISYRSRWALTDRYLDDRPTYAKIRKFKANGRDMRRSTFATELKDNLMSYDPNNLAKVDFQSDTQMTVTSKDTTIYCAR